MFCSISLSSCLRLISLFIFSFYKILLQAPLIKSNGRSLISSSLRPSGKFQPSACSNFTWTDRKCNSYRHVQVWGYMTLSLWENMPFSYLLTFQNLHWDFKFKRTLYIYYIAFRVITVYLIKTSMVLNDYFTYSHCKSFFVAESWTWG